ncbi:hypothetical protein QQF64_008964 [Cirrhinus molitorella]|uniref:Uncharacterized protein n=1 Tax=Cirrhinus molitorella TaxID=172907 RepID=A0ABR3M7Q9_9TELE
MKNLGVISMDTLGLKPIESSALQPPNVRDSKLEDYAKLWALLMKVLITDGGSGARRLTCLCGRQTLDGMECLYILSDEVSGSALEMTGVPPSPFGRDPTPTMVSPVRWRCGSALGPGEAKRSDSPWRDLYALAHTHRISSPASKPPGADHPLESYARLIEEMEE